MFKRVIGLTFVAVGLAAAGACTDGGGQSGTLTQGDPTLFDDFFSASGANSATDGAATGSETPCDPGSECNDPGTPGEVTVLPPIECAAPYAAPAAATAPCQSFCAKVAACHGHPEATAACASDCRASLGGTEVGAASQVLACFEAADCEAILAWNGGGGDVATPEPVDTQPEPSSGSGSDGGGASDSEGGASDPANPEGQIPPDWVEPTPNPIAVCIDSVFEGFAAQTLPAAKQAVCEATLADSCTSSGSSSGSNGSGAETDPAPQAGSEGAAPPAEAPADPGVPVDEGGTVDGDDTECRVVATLLTQAALDRIGACVSNANCEARSACLDQELACLPFISSIFGLSRGSDGGTTTVDTTEPASVPPSEPQSP